MPRPLRPRRGGRGRGLLPGERPRHLPPPDPPEPAQPVRPGGVLVAAARPEGPVPAALRPRPAGARGVAANPAGVPGQGTGRGRCQGSPDPGPLPGVPLAADALFRPAVRDVVLTGLNTRGEPPVPGPRSTGWMKV